jgi:hypothetical protein
MSVASKTLYNEPLSPTSSGNEKKFEFPWQKKERKRKEAEEKVQTLERLRQIDLRKHQLDLEEERQRRLAIEDEQHQQRARAQRIEQEKRDKEVEAFKNRLKIDQLEAQRKAEIEARRMANSPEALQHLRELVRQRYELDMEIWQDRNVPARDRDTMVDKMKRADGLLREIQETVRAWKFDSEVWTEDEIVIAKDIRDALLEDGKRVWQKQSPWGTTGYKV